MKQIKFKAWNKRNKMMVTNGFSIYYNGKIQFADGVNQEDFILMQFTGLLDKTGKEIYEGDILKWLGTDEPNIEVVKWDIEMAMFTTNYDTEREPLWYELSEEIEVIGNIYENPNLLKHD